MSIEAEVIARAGGMCELCGAEGAAAWDVPLAPAGADGQLAACPACTAQLTGETPFVPEHWQGLSERMWSEVPAVQGTAWRVFDRLRAEAWAAELLEMLYLEPEVQAWAEEGRLAAPDAAVVHLDSNGAVLATGDTVTLIKDLPVKGAGFTAKRGTAVRGIALDPTNAKHIEGRVNGQRIVILCEYVKKG